MRDIVATIQAEQDEVIRAPLDECLIVQGGPGTGKTAVGLHRAAFLLFEHRELLGKERLLVVGPNQLFLRYIAQVLPSLGETAVTQTTLPGLLESRYRVRAVDPAPVAAVKGDPRMAVVIERAARAGLVTRVPGEIELRILGLTLPLPAVDVQAVLDAVHARDGSLRAGRDQLRGRLELLALDRFTALRPSADEEELRRALRTGKEMTAAVNALWPVPSPPVLVRKLLGNRRFLADAASEVLTDDEQSLLFRRPSGKQTDEQWTRGDLGLLDEAEFIVGGPPRAFGHVVVDEAQDHSAMELRLLARRSPGRSMTILGDLAQATATGAQTRWCDALSSLDAPHGRVTELELGYRVPAPVLDFANRLLPVAAPDVRPSRSVRVAGEEPTVVRCANAADVVAAIVTAVVAERADERSVGVVAPEPLLDAIADALRAAAVTFSDGRAAVGLGDAVTLIPPESAKGLEFDAVIVVEPVAIAALGDHGLRLLYIALTRAVRTLTLIHSTPLPKPLR
jgi:DNA helicase IV